MHTCLLADLAKVPTPGPEVDLSCLHTYLPCIDYILPGNLPAVGSRLGIPAWAGIMQTISSPVPHIH